MKMFYGILMAIVVWGCATTPNPVDIQVAQAGNVVGSDSVVYLSGERGAVELFASYIISAGVPSSAVSLTYGAPAMGTYEGKPWPGVRYQVGTSGSNEDWVPVSNKRVTKGTLCDLQKKRAEEVASVWKKTAKVALVPAYCPSGNCWPKKPRGSYTTLKPYQGVRMVWNSNNSRYPVCSVSYKLEYHGAGLNGWPYGTGWGPSIIIRNASSCDADALLRASASQGLAYLSRALPQKKGQPGREGDSCFEVTVSRNGTVIKDESPREVPW